MISLQLIIYILKIKIKTMNKSYLTIDEISEIDTLTLEEKVEDLQNADLCKYGQVLALAKAQLAERYKVEQFGHKLLNDQISIVVPKLPMKQSLISATAPVGKQAKINRKEELAQLLKKSLVSDNFCIGKPTVQNYRYNPRNTPYKKSSKTSNNVNKYHAHKKDNKSIKKTSKINVKSKILPPIPKKSTLQPEVFLKQQIKEQNSEKKLEIKYIENDVYDDISTMPQQKFVHITERQIQQVQQIPTEQIMDQSFRIDEKKQNSIQEIIFTQSKKETKQQEFYEIKVLSPMRKQFTKQVFERKKQKNQVVEKYQQNTQNKQESQTIDKVFQQTTPRLKQSLLESPLIGSSGEWEKIGPDTRKSKSKSVTKFMSTHLPSNHGVEILPLCKPISKHGERKNKANSQLKIVRALPLYLPYHQQIPSFSHLFPHSANLINDLRAIEQNLQIHLRKSVNTLSKADQYLRVREVELLFRVVSETQKANKYSHIFDIDLSSFSAKSRMMVKRLQQKFQAPQDRNMLFYRVIRQKEDVYDIVNSTFHRTNDWFELPHGMDLKVSWNLLWTWSKPIVELSLLCKFQKFNHYLGNREIARKDLLKKNIERYKKLGPKAKIAFDIIPQTFFLPAQNMQFIRKFTQYQQSEKFNYWIIKPIGLSRGRGIHLISKLEQIVFNEPVIVQKYLQNPLLLNGYKFDLRIYVLVTCLKPLTVYIYKEGFARLSTQKYTVSEENIHDRFIHLTNFSVQKEKVGIDEDKYMRNDFQRKIGGCKITLKMLREKLEILGISWADIWAQIEQIVLKSQIACMERIQPNPNSFQLFGYDIIIDQQLKCWLIEVNSSPSLEKEFTIDEILKQQLVDDVIDVINPIKYDRERMFDVVTRRRKQLQGLKSHINTQNNSTQQLNADIDYILHSEQISQQNNNNNFIRLTPSVEEDNIMKIIHHYRK